MNPQLIQRIETLAFMANSNAKTFKGQLRAAVNFYREHRQKKTRKNKVTLRPKLSEEERENRRIKADQKYRKNWINKTRRILSKSTIYDVLEKKHDSLISRAKLLGFNPCYPVGIVEKVQNIKNFAEEISEKIFQSGESFSGNESYRYRFAPGVNIETETSSGERYSSKCTYRKTDALHKFSFTVAGIVELMKIPESVLNQSQKDGLILVSASNIKSRTAEVIWAKGKKKFSSESGAISWDFFKNEVVMFHAKNVKAAKVGLDKKIKLLAEQEENIQRQKLGMPPLWKPVIRISDIRPLTGWCLPGIRQWIQNYLGKNCAVAEWKDVARGALKDSSSYGQTLRRLLGIIENGPYAF